MSSSTGQTSVSNSRAAPQVRLMLPQAFAVGYVVWTVPCGVRFAFDLVTFRQFVYGGVWLALLYTLALTIIAVVYRSASNRGLSLKVSCMLSLAATLPALMIFYFLDFAVTRWDPSLATMPMERATILSTFATALADSVATVSLLAAIVFLPVFAKAHEERSHAIESLEREAELLRYRAHLEPHFVLNSLNAVAGLVEEDPPQARELLAALGDLFREANAFHPTHRVRDEIEWLKRYVIIHQLRHPDLLRPEWDVTPAALDLTCPALLLQPLVENAVKHGALRGKGHLAVRARVEDTCLALTIEDDGPELGAPRAGGRGISIIRRRLALEGLDASAFELVREGANTVARVRLPLRPELSHA